MSKILITGIGGFAASHLAKRLVEAGHEVHGTVRVRSDLHRIDGLRPKLTLHFVELTDPVCVNNLLVKEQFDQIYHLAAQSYVKTSWSAPLETFATNVDGTVAMFEAIRQMGKKPRVLVTSTSEVYGEVAGTIDEDTPPRPNTPYGVSKLCQDMVARMYQKAYGLEVVVTRCFNVTGWGRADVFVDSDFAKQIVEMERGLRAPLLRHGNLASERDFVDVEDAVAGYILAMEKGVHGEIYCFASGEPRSIQEVLDTLVAGSTLQVIKTEADPARFRPVDTKTMKGCSDKAKRNLGWAPKVSFKDSMESLLAYWRNRL